MGTDLEAPMTEEALAAFSREGAGDASDFRVPFLKIGQQLTAEVTQGDAKAGDLIHSGTGQVYTKPIQVVVVQHFKGRAWRDKENNKFYSTRKGEVVVPGFWNHPSSGDYFVDAPDADEQFRKAVDANQRDWGSGPPISTTYNFVMLILDEEGEPDGVPVLISLLKSSEKVGKNWNSNLTIGGAPWKSVWEVSTSSATSKKGQPYAAAKVKLVGPANADQRQAAISMATALLQRDGDVAYDQQEDPDAPAPAEATGGLGHK